jgi:hypothetical protein
MLKHVEVHLSYPLSALAPRTKHLEGLLELSRLRLFVDLAETQRKFDSVATAIKAPLRLNNRPSALAAVSPIRVLRQFLPVAEGGADSSTPSRKERFEVALIPWTLLPPAIRESSFSQTALVQKFQMAFGLLFVQFPLPAANSDIDTGAVRPDALMRGQGGNNAPSHTRDDPNQRFKASLMVPEKSAAAQPFVHYSLASKSLRDDMLRGRLDEAVAKCNEAIEQVTNQRNLSRAETDADARMGRWLEESVEAQAQLQRAQRQNSAAEIGAAQRRIAELWVGSPVPGTDNAARDSRPSGGDAARLPIWLVWLLGHTAAPMGAEATYMLALCKHEQAEQLQSARGPGAEERAKDAWRTAIQWWSQYLEEHPTGSAAASARACKARALEMLGNRDAAGREWESISGNLTPLEQVARAYRLRSLKR